MTGAMICAPRTGCAFIIIRSSRVSRLLLEEDRVRDPDLADVVEQPTPLEGLQLRLVDPHHAPDVDRDLLDAPAVLRGVRVALVDRLGKRADRLGEHLAHLDEPLGRQARRVQRQREQQRGPPLDRVDDRHEPPERRKARLLNAVSLESPTITAVID